MEKEQEPKQKKELKERASPWGEGEADRKSPNSKNHFAGFRYNSMKINNFFYLQGVLGGSLLLTTKIA